MKTMLPIILSVAAIALSVADMLSRTNVTHAQVTEVHVEEVMSLARIGASYVRPAGSRIVGFACAQKGDNPVCYLASQ